MAEFKLIVFDDTFTTEYVIFTEKEIIDDWFEIDRPEAIPLRLKNTSYYLKKLKEKEFRKQLNKL